MSDTSSRMGFTYYFFSSISRILANTLFSYRVVHPERMIEDGPLILAANHSSYFDPPLVGIASKRAVCYLARKNLLEWPLLGNFFPGMNVIPVEREGNDMNALRTVIRTIKSGNGVVLFPEGTRSKDGQLQSAKSGIGMIIAKTGAPVLPVRVFGAYEAFPRGAKKFSLTQISVVLGEPIRFTPEELKPATRENYQLLSDRVMQSISALRLP